MLDNPGLGIRVIDVREPNEYEIAKFNGAPLLPSLPAANHFARLELLGKRRKESGAAGGPQGRESGSERVHAGMRASVNTIVHLLPERRA